MVVCARRFACSRCCVCFSLRCFDALVLVAGWLRASAWASSLARWAVARASVTRLEARFCGRLVSLCPEGPSGPGVCLDSFADIGMCLLRAAHLRRTMQAVRRAGDGTRTRDSLLGRQELYQTELLPLGMLVVGVRGLEPRTSWSQTMRATNCATPRKRAF